MVKAHYGLLRLLPLFLGMGLVTFLPRYLPMAILTRLRLPEGLLRWLGMIPAAILAALAAQSLLVRDGALGLRADYLGAAVPTVLVAWRTKNLFLTVVVGMAAAVAARVILGL